MAKNNYEHLSLDEATTQLGEICDRYREIMLDRNRGLLSATFAVSALMKSSGYNELLNRVCTENGISREKEEGAVCRDIFAELARVTKARGDSTAEKFDLFSAFQKTVSIAMSDIKLPIVKGPFATIRRAAMARQMLLDKLHNGPQ